MTRTHRRSILAGTALATMALTLNGLGVAAQDASPAASGAATPAATVGLPATPTGYAELDKALDGTKPYNGAKVNIQTQWVAGEGTNFRETLAAFETATGIDVTFDEIGSSHETVLKTRIDGNAPPDLAVLAQPSPIITYGRDGKLIPIGEVLDTERVAAETPSMAHFYLDGDQLWALPYKVDVKGVVWYPIKAFEAAGYQVPTTWDELVALSDQIIADGNGNPWCVGMESGTATGWVATDWVEAVVQRTAGPEVYDQWVAGELAFDSPEIRAAFDIVGQILFSPDYVYGGNTAILASSTRIPMDPMFNEDLASPQCWMHNLPFWYGPEFFPDQRASGQPSKFVIGEDVGLFPLPPIDPEFGSPALGAGDGLIVLNSSRWAADAPPAGTEPIKAVVQFLSTPAGIETWVRKGAALSPNNTVPADWYSGYEPELAAKIVADASFFSFDASDLMPGVVGAGTFWTELVKWIQANGENTDDVLAAIDASWPAPAA
jgi:alpha-glucoside transport system substrate-binding protein